MLRVDQKQLKLRTKPWVNPHIQKLINYRDKLLRKLRKSHSKNTEELYKKFRNRVVRENRTSKKKYFETYFQTNKSNMKSLWAGINSIINSRFRKSVQNISQLAVNSKTCSDPQKMASIFNNFFVNVSNQVCSEISRTKKSPLDYLTHHTPVPTVVVIKICLLYSQRRLYSSQNIRGFYVIYFCSGNNRGVLYFELRGMMS